jgi:hypothetical protein
MSDLPQFNYHSRHPNGGEETFEWTSGSIAQCEQAWRFIHNSTPIESYDARAHFSPYPTLPSPQTPASTAPVHPPPTVSYSSPTTHPIPRNDGLPSHLEANAFFDYLGNLSPEEIDKRWKADQVARGKKSGGVIEAFNRQPESVHWTIGFLITGIAGFLFFQNPSVQQALHNMIEGTDSKPATSNSEQPTKPNVTPIPELPPPDLP